MNCFLMITRGVYSLNFFYRFYTKNTSYNKQVTAHSARYFAETLLTEDCEKKLY